MKQTIFIYIFSIYFQGFAVCKSDLEDIKLRKQPLPYFRRKVEGILDENPDDSSQLLSRLLAQNLREAFNKFEEDDIISDDIRPTLLYSQKTNRPVKLVSNENYDNFEPDYFGDPLRKSMDVSYTKMDTNKLLNKTFSRYDFSNVQSLDNKMLSLDNKMPNQSLHFFQSYLHKKSSLPPIRSPRNTLFLGKNVTPINQRKLYENGYFSISDELRNLTNLGKKKSEFDTPEVERKSDEGFSRSCIMCDNVAVEHCTFPRNKLIPSTICNEPNSACYSMHTPFGIVDRGCFNMNQNLTTYVCACNLCNYMSIDEMPKLYTSKRDWIANVYDLSHASRLRKSMRNEVSCFKCEVNGTASRFDLNGYDSACLNGIASLLPIQVCQDNEICAVKAIKGQHYMWRGCINFPLFNYYIRLCDSDLCNYDAVLSIYDTY